MLNRLTELVIGIIMTIFLFVIIILIFNKETLAPNLVSENFEKNLVAYDECYNGDDRELATQLYENGFNFYSLDELNTIFTNSFKNSCNAEFTRSSDEQVKEMAKYLQEQIDFTLTGAVYTANPEIFALNGIPQEYVFIALNDDQTIIAAYKIKISLDDDSYQIEELYQTADLEEAKILSDKLLLMYNEKVY